MQFAGPGNDSAASPMPGAQPKRQHNASPRGAVGKADCADPCDRLSGRL